MPDDIAVDTHQLRWLAAQFQAEGDLLGKHVQRFVAGCGQAALQDDSEAAHEYRARIREIVDHLNNVHTELEAHGACLDSAARQHNAAEQDAVARVSMIRTMT